MESWIVMIPGRCCDSDLSGLKLCVCSISYANTACDVCASLCVCASSVSVRGVCELYIIPLPGTTIFTSPRAITTAYAVRKFDITKRFANRITHHSDG